MIEEVALRRPDFLPGSPVRLADGRWWTLPDPPRPDARGAAAPGGWSGFGPDYAATVAAVGQAEDEAERRRAELALAICLLVRNYDLTADTLCALLGDHPGDPSPAAMQEAFHQVAQEHARSARASVEILPPRAVPGRTSPDPIRTGVRRRRVPSRSMGPSWGRIVAWFRSLLGRFFDPPTSTMRP